jgi:hypothetical protein
MSRVWAALFAAYWLLTSALSVENVLTDGELSGFQFALQALCVVFVGGFVAFLGGRTTVGMACGAALESS